MSESPYFSHEYREFHAYIDSIRKVKLRFTLTSLNRALWKLKGAVLPGGVFIQSIWGGSAAIGQARTPPVGINILIHQTGEFTGMGEEMTPGAALLMPPGSMNFTHTPGGYGSYSIFIPAGLARSVDSLRFLIDKDWRDVQVVQSDAATSMPAGEKLEEFFSGFDGTRGFLPKAGSLLEFRDELFDSLSTTYGHRLSPSKNRRGRPLRANEHALARAVDVVENQKKGKTRMADLAGAARVSEARLRYAFQRYLGLSPSEYIRIRRFNMVWQILSASRATDTTVARVLAEFQVLDMGRFAKRYRRIFGENPSTTLGREKQAEQN